MGIKQITGIADINNAIASSAPLPPAAEYFPPDTGVYEVKPGLFPFGEPFGNGLADRQLFQLDNQFERYRTEKLEARRENLNKYFLTSDFPREHEGLICAFICWRLQRDYPDYFQLKENSNGYRLSCRLSSEEMQFSNQWRLEETRFTGTHLETEPAYRSALDALACQLQEDLSVIRVEPEKAGHVTAIHLCFPNYWAAEEKIGRDFVDVHKPVAGIDSVNQAAAKIVKAMVSKGPFVRFSWGITTDDRLNHHPVAPKGKDTDEWTGRNTNNGNNFFLRVERQVAWGFPEIDSALFTIRTYLQTLDAVATSKARRNALRLAIESMSEQQLDYKGMAAYRDDLICRLSD